MTEYSCYLLPTGVTAVIVEANTGDLNRAAALAATKTQISGHWLILRSVDGAEFNVRECRTYSAERIEDDPWSRPGRDAE